MINTELDRKNKKGKYIISGQFCFDPEVNAINLIERDSNILIYIAIPASGCLQVLLKNHGKVVTKERLLEEVWGVKKINVSLNTLYQNIHIIRRSLIKCGCSEDIIKTIPRRGITIPDEITVVWVEDIATQSPSKNKEKSGEEISVKLQYDNDVVGKSSLTSQNTEKKSHTTLNEDLKMRRINKPKKMVFGMIAALTAFSISFAFGLHAHTHTHLPMYNFSNYYLVETTNECSIYVSSLRLLKEGKDILKSNGFVCADKKYFYITKALPSEKFSIFICTTSINNVYSDRENCDSHFFMGDK